MTTQAEQGKWIRGFICNKGPISRKEARVEAVTRFHEKVLHYEDTHPADPDVSSPDFRDSTMAKTLGTALVSQFLTHGERDQLERIHRQQPPHTLAEKLPPNVRRLSDFRKS